MLKNVLKNYKAFHPEYDRFVCNFVFLRGNNSDNFLFKKLSEEFKQTHDLPNYPAFLGGFVERHQEISGTDVNGWYEMTSIYREYFIEWLEDRLEQEEKIND